MIKKDDIFKIYVTMTTTSNQRLLAEFILQSFPEAIVKKIDEDNYLDIHIPTIHPKKGTHLFFNTSKKSIKIGFYCREESFVQQALKNGDGLLEEYSQGIRLKGNPEFTNVETAFETSLKFVKILGQNSAPITGASKTKTETYTFKKAVNAFLKGNLEYVAAYVEAGNPILQFNGEILITNELISYVSAFSNVDQRIIDLVEAGVDLDGSFENGEEYTALHFAAWDGKDEILSFLIDEGAKVDLVGEDGFTPLLLAAAGGHQECIEILVKNGADVNRRVKDGNIYFSKQGGTPLTVSFINGFLGTALFLIENGADPFVLLEPCQNAPSPNLFVNFLSLVKEGAISKPEEGQLSKILGLVGQDENLTAGDSEVEKAKSSSLPLDLNAFLNDLDSGDKEELSEEDNEDEEETESSNSEDELDLASFLDGLGQEVEKANEVSKEKEEEEEEEEDDDDDDDELGYPMIAWWGENINQEKLNKYADKWQSKSEVYGWVMGISGYLPDWFEDFISDKICPAFNNKELLEISNRVANEKIIPVLKYSPEELYFHVKSVWWIIPFCIWKEEIASFVFIDKNGFYAMFKNKEGEVEIGFIFPWDRVSNVEFETEYGDDPCVNRLTLYQDNGGFLTFDEFVGFREDGTQQGSYLSVAESIWEARKGTIEASAGVPMWYEGKGGEGFVEFEKPQDLLKDSKWKKPFRPNPGMYGG